MSDISDIEAKVLFDSDRTCCVCRDRTKKHIQIHHIDGNHQNSDPDNLAVLCLDCHADTQLKGGFTRKLSPGVVKLYRDDWLAMVRDERRSKLPGEEARTHLMFTAVKDPLQKFLQQFEDNHILPLGTTFRFRDYYFYYPGFPTLVIDSDNMKPENGDRRKSILKAYLLCVLGIVAPPMMLVSDTFDPSQSSNSVQVGGGVKIAVPRWYVAGFEELGWLHLTGQYLQSINQIVLTLRTAFTRSGRNYDLLGVKLEKIALAFKGTDLVL